MKFCEDHWNKLRNSVTANSLDYLVSSNAKEAAVNMRRDPLIIANTMVIDRIIEIDGPEAIAKDICPICYVIEQTQKEADEQGIVRPVEEIEEYWIDGPVKAIRKKFGAGPSAKH